MLKKTGWISFVSVLAFFIMLFYFGLYKYLLAGNSASFVLEDLRHVAMGHRDATLVVLGDSTAAEGFRPNRFNREAIGEKAVNLGVPGGWLFTFHKSHRLAKKYMPGVKKVVLFLGPDNFRAGGDRLRSDLEYNKTSLDLADADLLWDYSGSFKELCKDLFLFTFRPALFSRDMRDLVENPAGRARRFTENIKWFNRKVSDDDPLWEDTRDYSVCGTGDPEDLPARIDSLIRDGNRAEAARYKEMYDGYMIRKGDKRPNPFFVKGLLKLLGELSSQYNKVYLLNAPVFSGFGKVYSPQYLQETEIISKAMASLFPNVIFIEIPQGFRDNCRNFMDVVHVNKTGAQKLTDFIVNAVAASGIKKMVLKDYGPRGIKAGQAFNIQEHGESAIWANTENATASAVLVLNGVPLKSVAFPDGCLVTAIVPAELVKRPGKYDLQLMDRRSNMKSNKLKLTVQK